MGATNNKKKRKKKKQSANLVITFLCTLTGVVILGVGALILYNRFAQGDSEEAEAEETAQLQEAEPDPGPVSEAIPEEDDQDETAEEQVPAEEQTEQSKYADELADAEYMEANQIYVRDPADTENGTVTLTFAGDILFDDEYAVTATLKQNGGEISAGIMPEVLKVLQESDVTMVNNEFPYTSRGTATEGKQYTFRADPDTVRYLSDMGVDVVSIANNHAYDFGEEGFLDTLDTLDGAGMPYVGGGNNIDEASAPVYFIVGDIKIGILAATQIERVSNPDTKGATSDSAGVFRCLDNSLLLEKIAETKENCDFVVVYIHWGTESTTEIDWAQTEQGPQMVSAGADLIIGDHPHVLQPIGVIDGVPVVYSLGNFWFNSKEMDTCMIQATLSEQGLESLQFIPCRQSGCKTSLLTGSEAERVLNDMRYMSPDVSFDSEGYITY